jgi:hypothetical protein
VPDRETGITLPGKISKQSARSERVIPVSRPGTYTPRVTRRNRRWFVHVLSLALLFAQLGMVVHASSHLKPDPHATPTQSQLCGECISFTSMQNMVGGTSTVADAVTVTQDRARECDAVSLAPHRAFSAFRSRAPPVSVC